MKNNLSQEQLIKSLDRRMKHLMIRTLERFENGFPQVDNTRDGQLFKGDIRTIFNDMLRAQRDELRDYYVDYRPLRMNDDNTLAMTQTFMQSVQKIEFGFKENLPYFTITAALDKVQILEAIRYEFDVGVVFIDEEKQMSIFQVIGTNDCINHVLPRMDKYHLHNNVRINYKEWRNAVIRCYIH